MHIFLAFLFTRFFSHLLQEEFAMVSFASPNSKLVFEQSSFNHPKTRHNNVINEHLYNYSVNVTLPGCASIAKLLDGDLTTQEHFIIRKLKLVKLLDTEVVMGFIKSGKLFMMSHDTHIDKEDCAGVTPSGLLVLNLVKDTFEALGLDGSPSEFNRKSNSRYVVTIDLLHNDMRPGTKKYVKTLQRLEALDLKFDFMFNWEPNDNKISQRSLPVYLRNNGYKVRKCRTERTQTTYEGINVPSLQSSAGYSKDDDNYLEVYEWLGAVACAVEVDASDPLDEISSYTCQVPNTYMNKLTIGRYTGFFTTGTISRLLQNTRDLMKENKLPWASVTIHGFADSPLSWKHREHGYHKGGENLYTYVVFPNDEYWLYMAIGTHDICP
ncbi:unnamed protein product [Owenia fusiformis]|uniref:Uncharacterized protein n=1 Tax=Owenia fusiformis TaxID=6347 RepID=A0A8S4NGQ1_OWEFU|nr:unnamed protein product [Owenia fusiformis]